ncbi:unnamed protein product [Phytophthora lilii]|uniref:Unnamed protein product n=1 Tax=Phytophthora lilii TaxID=2077276 RepID=A0A9W7CJY2_9STRA|nr:unnamed protein product [Phytophthora lilii]
MTEIAANTEQKLPTAASLFPASSHDIDWQSKLNSVDMDEAVASKAAPNWVLEDDEDNQQDDGPHKGDSVRKAENHSPWRDNHGGSNELQHLRDENTDLMQRITHMKTQHAQQISALEEKLQQAIETHRAVEQQLSLQLKTVMHEQQAAVENARKVSTILTRVSNWVRQVQRSAPNERLAIYTPKPVVHDLELAVTPSNDAPYNLWTSRASPANVLEYQEESAAIRLKPTCKRLHRSASDAHIESVFQYRISTLPPPAPGRNRAKSMPGTAFNYVKCSSKRSSEVVSKPVLGPEIVLDGLPSDDHAPRKDTPLPKRSASSLLAYCAQVVTTSLTSVRSSPEPRAKVTPAWKLDLSPVQEELEIDEEAGQCKARSLNRNQRLNVALPSLSIGLL